MTEPAFGDNVRIRTTPETQARGLAGSRGSVTGVTTPSVTSVEVIGVLSDDYALAVTLDQGGETYWFTPELLDFVDHAPGTEMWVSGAPFKSVRTETGEWVDVPVMSAGGGHRNVSLVAWTFGIAAALQLFLGAYRALLLRVSLLPAVLFALALGAVGVLYWLRNRAVTGHIIVRPVGVVLMIAGSLATLAAARTPFLGLVSRVSVPILLISVGFVLLSPRTRWRTLLLALILFVGAFVGIQLAFTQDARWQAENRVRGINAIWR